MLSDFRYIKPRLYGALGYRPYFSFSYLLLDTFLRGHYQKNGFIPLNYYEFGTGKGYSLRDYLSALRRILRVDYYFKIAQNVGINILLFDSFEGLPVATNPMDSNKALGSGNFSGSVDYIKNMVEGYSLRVKPNVRIVKGFYENSLTSTLQKQIHNIPPSFVNIDVDYFNSAWVVLNFVAPLCQNGTAFHFNNIYEYLGNLDKGEFGALSKFNLENSNRFHLFLGRIFNISEFYNKVFSFHSLEKTS